VVDVRDLATAHYKAGFEPNANGRNIANAHNTNFYEMCLILHEIYGDFYPIPNKKAPKWLIWLIGPILNKGLSRKYVSNNIGYIFKANNSKIKKELNVEFRSLTQTLKDSFDSLVRSEIIVKK
jgi:dihydroflavonol-4-reductase